VCGVVLCLVFRFATCLYRVAFGLPPASKLILSNPLMCKHWGQYNIGTPLPISRYADMMVHASPEKYLHIRFPAMANMTMYTPITVILCTELLIMSEYVFSGFPELGLWLSDDTWTVAAVSSSVEVLERWDDIYDRVSAITV